MIRTVVAAILPVILVATLLTVFHASVTGAGATQSYWPPQSTLNATNVGPTSMNLSWTPAVIVPGGYSFYHLYSDGVYSRQLGQGTSHHVDGFAPLTTYHFTVELGDFSVGYIPGPSMNITTPAMPADADFTISISPNPLQIPIGGEGWFTVKLVSIQGFYDLVGISTRVTSNSGQVPIPFVGYTATSIMLGESGANTSSFDIDVHASTAPAGAFILWLDGVSHTRSHESSAEIIVGSVLPPHELELVRYQLSYTGFATPGGSITLLNNFTAIGPVDVTILNTLFSWDMRINASVPKLPTTLSPGQNTSLSLKFNIPRSAPLGRHNIHATVSWEYYYNSSWIVGRPIAVNGTLTVKDARISLATTCPFGSSCGFLTGLTRSNMFVPAIVSYLIAATVLSMIFFFREKSRRSF